MQFAGTPKPANRFSTNKFVVFCKTALSTRELQEFFCRITVLKAPYNILTHTMAESPGRKSTNKMSRGNIKMTKKLTPLEGLIYLFLSFMHKSIPTLNCSF
jgi:hypothetical protein